MANGGQTWSCFPTPLCTPRANTPLQANGNGAVGTSGPVRSGPVWSDSASNVLHARVAKVTSASALWTCSL